MDKTQYKASDEEYKQVYYKNHLDKQDLTEEEIAKIAQEVNDFDNFQAENRQTDEERKIVDLGKVRSMFDTIIGKFPFANYYALTQF